MRNKTVELVNAWAIFEEKYPKGDLTEFCRHFLSQNKIAGSVLNENCNTRFDLSRTINQLSRLWMVNTQQAIRSFELSNFDEFVFLYTVQHVKEINKKDLTYLHHFEISSGLLIIDRLIQKKMLKETINTKDKRAKLLTMTTKGKKVLVECKVPIDEVAREMFSNMPEEDMQLCTQLLLPIQNKNAKTWYDKKGFDPQREK